MLGYEALDFRVDNQSRGTIDFLIDLYYYCCVFSGGVGVSLFLDCSVQNVVS